jgi:antitoxin ParD1/3/4
MHSRQMSISLNPTHEQFVLSKIENGKYANVDEVIAAAFQLLEEQEKQYAVWLEDRYPQEGRYWFRGN